MTWVLCVFTVTGLLLLPVPLDGHILQSIFHSLFIYIKSIPTIPILHDRFLFPYLLLPSVMMRSLPVSLVYFSFDQFPVCTHSSTSTSLSPLLALCTTLRHWSSLYLAHTLTLHPGPPLSKDTCLAPQALSPHARLPCPLPYLYPLPPTTLTPHSRLSLRGMSFPPHLGFNSPPWMICPPPTWLESFLTTLGLRYLLTGLVS